MPAFRCMISPCPALPCPVVLCPVLPCLCFGSGQVLSASISLLACYHSYHSFFGNSFNKSPQLLTPKCASAYPYTLVCFWPHRKFWFSICFQALHCGMWNFNIGLTLQLLWGVTSQMHVLTDALSCRAW